jgi:hypothetical protein
MTSETTFITPGSEKYNSALIEGLKSEVERLKSENALLKTALQDQIDYHHFIGNEDCPISINESLIYLYNNAKEALKQGTYAI